MSKCICNDYGIQIEGEIKFYDPDNKCLRRTDGKKYRFFWVGCPVHKGRTFYKIPSLKVGLAEADAKHAT